ncbi:MAG: hypothetical protein ACFFFH_06340 [Candidatus Thorarchaeota archaeon]
MKTSSLFDTYRLFTPKSRLFLGRTEFGWTPEKNSAGAIEIRNTVG